MPWHFYMMIGLSLLAAYRFGIRPKGNETIFPGDKPLPELKTIKFFGGPMDAQETAVEELQEYYVTPYLPEDESEREVTMEITDPNTGQVQRIFKPHFAFYTLVMDNSYFYKRDVSHDELVKLNNTGELPA